MVAGAYMAGNYFGAELDETAWAIGTIPQWNTGRERFT